MKLQQHILYRIIPLLLVLLMPLTNSGSGSAQSKPMILPISAPPGPSTWMFGQAYGNTLGAFSFGQDWYSAGQGLHFGLDLPMPCGTPLVAVADGEIAYVDNMSFGSGPHNLILNHPQLQLTTLYGHLLETPTVFQGQQVTQGEIIAYSGDPDSTCDSRPHLHFEVRSPDFRTAYNPVDYIEANWHILTAIGGYSYPLFQQDLTNPRQWLSVDNQPIVQFGGRILNNFAYAWPPASDDRPIENAPLARTLNPLPENTQWELRRLTFDNCCARFWWHPTDPTRFFLMDGATGTIASIQEWDVINGVPVSVVQQAPPNPQSPDGNFSITRANTSQFTIQNRLDGTQYFVGTTQNAWPSISPDNSKLLWVAQQGRFVPGGVQPPTDIWVSEINGANVRPIVNQRGGSAQWLDGNRVLMSTPMNNLQSRAINIYNLNDGTTFTLGVWDWFRGTSVSPGGKHMAFYLSYQPDPAANGVYIIETQLSAVAQHMTWFGAWRWRDADTLYYLPFDPAVNSQSLAYYDLRTGENRVMDAPPFTIGNGEWAVSADGQRILFQSAGDFSLYVLEAVPTE